MDFYLLYFRHSLLTNTPYLFENIRGELEFATKPILIFS